MYEIGANLLRKRNPFAAGLACLNLAGGSPRRSNIIRNTQERYWLAVFNECFAL